MKIILTMMLLCSIMIIGCSGNSKVKTAPWTDTEVERMEYDEIKSVPLFLVRN